MQPPCHMREKRARPLGRSVRLVAAVLLTIAGTAAVTPVSTATPTRQDIRNAQAQLDTLNERLSLLVEEYDLARLELEAVQEKLDQARADGAEARAAAAKARTALEKRAVAAYTDTSSSLSAVLGATSFTEFSDRIEFLGQLAQQDADLATEAETAEQQAAWAAERLEKAEAERSRALARIKGKESEIRSGIADQKALIQRYEEELAAAAERRREQRRTERLAAQQAAEEQAQQTGGGGNGGGPAPGGGGTPPPVSGSGAQAAVSAAYSVIGTKYQWGGADPSTGFDCSGLTMWAWAHAGVSLPHSSQAQYGVLPHVDRSQLQPGDLVFFYSPIHHVGIYVGGGRMIDAPHTGSYVQVRPVNWADYVGAGRPG